MHRQAEEEDFTACLGFAVPDTDEALIGLDPGSFKRMIDEVGREFPHFQAIATTLREVRSATVND